MAALNFLLEDSKEGVLRRTRLEKCTEDRYIVFWQHLVKLKVVEYILDVTITSTDYDPSTILLQLKSV